MTLQSKTNSETYYDILHVKENASYEEIRQSYRSALLQSHPDKLLNSIDMPNSGKDAEDRFVKVQQAWETLSDSRSRALYDSELQSLRSDELFTEDVILEDMTAEDTEEGLEFYYQCRCGDSFLISGSELEEIGCKLHREGDEISVTIPEALLSCVILPCGSCSLRIRLSIDTSSTVSVHGASS